MAKLPGLETEARPVPKPATGIASIRGATGLEGAGAEALGVASREIAQAQAIFEKEQERIDNARAEDAFTQLREKQIDLAFGENGFTKAKGSDAITKPILKDYTGRFDSEVTRIAEGLANDRQRELFKTRAGVSRSQFGADLLKHIDTENNTYQQQVLKGTLAVETRDASEHWNDANAVSSNLVRINAAIDREAERTRAAPEMVAAAKLEAASKVHAAVIGQSLATGDYKYAEEWFKKNRGDIDPSTAKEVEKAVRDGTQKELFNVYNTQFIGAKDNIKALTALEKNLLGDKTLDETRKNILWGQIRNRIGVLENKAELAQARWERGIERNITMLNNLTMQGYEPSAEQMAPLVNATRGTSMEPLVAQMVNTANVTRQFRTADFRTQEQMLANMEAQARQNPGKFDVTLISKLRTIHQNQRQEVQDNPVGFVVRQGYISPDDAAAQPLNFQDPKVLSAQLPQRFDVARQVAARYAVPVKPLTQEEARDLTGRLANSGSVNDRLALFGTVFNASGKDMRGYSAVMRQIAPDNPVTAMAGWFAGHGMTGGQGLETARLILEGQAITNPNRKEDGNPVGGKPWPMPQGSDKKAMDEAFSRYTGNAWVQNPPGRAAHLEAAYAIYAALSARDPSKSGPTATLDTDRWKRAMELATGGVADYNGRKTLLPYNTDAGQFKNQVYTRIDGFRERLPQGVTPEDVRSLPLVPVGDNKYVFQSGDAVLADKDKKPIVLDFDAPMPVTQWTAPVTKEEEDRAGKPATYVPRKK